MPAPVPAPGSWVRSVDRAVLIGAAFILGLETLPVLGVLPRVGGTTRIEAVTLLVSQVVLLGCCLAALRPGLMKRARWVAITAGAGGLVAATLAVTDQGIPEYAAHTLPTNAVQALQLVAICFVARTTIAAALVVATGPAAVAVLAEATSLSGWEALDRWILPAASSVAIVVTLGRLRAGAATADALAEHEDRAADAARIAANADLAEDEARRIVHDEVITALRAVELGLPPADVRAACASALDVLGGSRETTDDLAQSLAEGSPLAVEVTDDGWDTRPPPRVTEAFRGAAAEALRNVQRHAGTDRARVRLGSAGDQLVVEVADDGPGIAAGRERGFGLRSSVIGRMEDVGGIADIDTGPSGTTVRLRWPARLEARPRPDMGPHPVLLDRRRAYLLVGTAPVLANLYVALRFPGAPDSPAWAGLLVWLVAGAVLVATAWRLGSGTPGPRLTLGVTAAVCAVVAVGLTVAGSGALLDVSSWVIGYGAVTLCLLAFEAPARGALGSLLALVGVVLAAAAVDPAVGVLEPVGALSTPALVVGVGMVLGVALRRATAAIEAAEARRRAREEQAAWLAGNARAREIHLAHLDSDVVPFLHTVLDGTAGGQVDPALLAGVLSAQCRDQLYLAAPLPERTRVAARDARLRGVTLTIRSHAGVGHIPAEGWSVLEPALVHATPEHTITVVPARGDRSGVRIVTVPPLPGLEAPDGAGARVTTDAIRTVVTLASPPVSPDLPTPPAPRPAAGWST